MKHILHVLQLSCFLLFVNKAWSQCIMPKISIQGSKNICEDQDVILTVENCSNTVFWYMKDPLKNKNVQPFDMGSRITLTKIKKNTTIFARCEGKECLSDVASYNISVTSKDNKINAFFTYGMNRVCQNSDIIVPIKSNKNTALGRIISIDSVSLSIKEGVIDPRKSKVGVYYVSNVVTLNECQSIYHTNRIEIKPCNASETCPTAKFKLPIKAFLDSDSTTYRPILDTLGHSGEWSLSSKATIDSDGGFIPSQLGSGVYIITNSLTSSKGCKKEIYSDTIRISTQPVRQSLSKQNSAILTNFATSSTTNSNIPSLVPPSPNAASLGKYGDIPVSYYTGQPSTSIPLYTIQSGDITLPISISYNHSGIKVEEEASNVGLGWSINSGGAITRTVRGLDDLRDRGIPFHPLPAVPETDPYVIANISDNNWGFPGIDTEPDVFYYNVGGESGKFILETNTQFPLKGIPLNKSDVSIVCTQINNSTTPPTYAGIPQFRWIITLANGLKYTFEEQEVATTVSGTGQNPQSYEWTNYSSMPSLSYNSIRSGRVITSWYLNSIESPNTKDIVTLNYDRTNYYYSTSRLGANEVYNYNTLEPINSAGSCTSPATLIPKDNTFSYSATITRNAYLKNIIFNKGTSSVEFTLSDRDDIQQYILTEGIPTSINLGDIDNRTYSSGIGKKPQKIDGFRVLSGSTEVKAWKFSYSYFNSNIVGTISSNPTLAEKNRQFNNLRLRLDQVQEREQNTTNTLPPYKFYYAGDVVNSSGQVVTPVTLPSKTSWAKDYWGYYNGKDYNNSGTHIIPQLVYPKMYGNKVYVGGTTGMDYTFTLMGFSNTLTLGIDREVDINYAKYGTLQTIVYPTGGNTQFDYESHKAWGGANDVETTTLTASNKGSSSVFNITYADNFMYYADIEFKLRCSSLYPGSTGGGCVPLSTTVPDASVWYGKVLYNGATNFKIRTYTDWANFMSSSPAPYNGYSNTEDKSIPLNFGSYQLVLNPVNASSGYFPDASMTMKIYKLYTTDYKEVTLGGLRIKKVTDRDAANIVKSKSFSYTKADGSTSGKQMRPAIKYIYGYKEILRIQDEHSTFYYGSGWSTNCVQKSWGVELNAFSLSPLGTSASGSHIGYDRVSVIEEGMNNGKTVFEYTNVADELPESVLFTDIPTTPYFGNGMPTKETYLSASNDIVKEVIYEPQLKAGTTTLYLGMKCLTPGFSYNNDPTMRLAKSYYKNKAEFWFNASKTEKIYSGANSVSSISKTYYNSTLHYLPTKTEIIDSKGNTITTNMIYPKDKVALNQDPTGVYAGMITKNIINPVIEEKTLNGTTQTSYKLTEYQLWGDFYAPKTIKTQIGTSDPLRTEVTFNSYNTTGKITSYTDKTGLTNTFTWWNEFDATKQHLLKSHTVNDQTSSYDYYPLIGLKSVTDPTGKITSYDYDGYGRLQSSKDLNSNLLNSVSYHWSNSSTYVPNCSIPAPSISVTDASLCTNTLTAAGCSGTVIWSNGSTGNSIQVSTQTSISISAVCSQNGCVSSSSNPITVPILPSSWSTSDVGAPSPGCTNYTAGNTTLSGSGLIWGNADAFHWINRPMSGDVTIITKISSMPTIDGKRSGLMIRSSNAPDAPFFEIILDGNGNVGKLKRRDSAGSAEFVGYASVIVGQTWLKLEKIGNQIKTYYRLDSQSNWNDFGWDQPTDNPNIGSSFLVGLITADNNNGLNTTTFVNTSINGQNF